MGGISSERGRCDGGRGWLAFPHQSMLVSDFCFLLTGHIVAPVCQLSRVKIGAEIQAGGGGGGHAPNWIPWWWCFLRLTCCSRQGFKPFVESLKGRLGKLRETWQLQKLGPDHFLAPTLSGRVWVTLIRSVGCSLISPSQPGLCFTPGAC